MGGDGGGGSLLGSDNGSLLAGEKYLEFKSSETLNAPRRLISLLVMLRGTLTALLRGSLLDEAIEALRCGKVLRFGSLPLTRLS